MSVLGGRGIDFLVSVEILTNLWLSQARNGNLMAFEILDRSAETYGDIEFFHLV